MDGADDDLRPMLAGPVRWGERSVVVDLGTRDVEVDGDGPWLRSVLGRCDGRTSWGEIAAQHGDDARALLATLLEHGAVVDAGDVWRVFHRQGSVGTALGRPLSAKGLRELQDTRPGGPARSRAAVALAPAAGLVGELAARRRSARVGDAGPPVSFAALSAILAAAYGVEGAGAARSGTVASAGALYPLTLHVALRAPLGPLDAGLHWLDPVEGTLRGIGPATLPAFGTLFVPEPACTALLRLRQPVVFVSADLGRPARKYGARGYRYALIEAGAAAQTATLAAEEHGILLRPIGGIDDGAVHRFLDLPDAAVPLLALLIGG